jgi:DHA2 family multidrug resistance protein
MDIRLFKSVNFSAACVQMFFIGVIGFASIVLIPQFLQRLLGYTASLSGQAISMGALVLFITMPAVGLLTPKIHARYLLALGWVMIAASLFLTCQMMNLGMSFSTASWVCVMQRIPVGLIYIPGTLAAYFGMAAEKSDSISGIINFVRNIGSSVGTSFVTTVLARRTQFHQSVLAAGVSPGNASLHWAAGGLSAHLHAGGLQRLSAQSGAYVEIYTEMVRQSAALSFVDTYWLLGAASALMFVTAFLIRKNIASGRMQSS